MLGGGGVLWSGAPPKSIVPSKKLVVVRMGLTPFNLAYKPQGLVSKLAKAME